MKYIDLATMQETDERPDVVVGLGNFDGVHIAHRELLLSVGKLASKMKKSNPNIKAAAWSFEIPSSDYLSKAPIGHLTTLEERLELFYEAGMDYAILDNFEAIKDMSAARFLTEKLIDEYHVQAAVCGYNFRFGAKGLGKPENIKAQMPCMVMPKRNCMGSAVSSSRIRWLLRAGDVELSKTLLGRNYALDAVVVEGKHLGRTLGIPTINQYFYDLQLVPRRGIYASIIEWEGHTYHGVSNIGVRPTVEHTAVPNCETHIFDFDGDLYGKKVKVSFCKRLRNEMQLKNVDVLKNTILLDIEHAKEYFETNCT